ncbi:unnamed protein product [Trichobilharzia regenti]|nr:unnamed protein product [Trichobilharzia regenti]
MLSPCQPCDRCQPFLTCANATWIIGRGIPTQLFVNTSLICVVDTTTNCFDECRRQTGCLSFSFRLPTSMTCCLYRSNITPNNLTMAGDPFWYGTMTCCGCNSLKWLSGLGSPDPITSKLYTSRAISNTSSCFNECQLDKGCSSYSFSTRLPGVCSFYSNELTQSLILFSTAAITTTNNNTNTTTTNITATNITVSSITNITAIVFATRRCCAGFVFISTCDNQSTMLNDTMNCTHSRWLAARGLPNESYLVNYTMTRVKTSKTCFFECQSNPNCHAYLFQLNSSTVCTLYNKPVDRSVPRSNRTSYHFGTRACCSELSFRYFIIAQRFFVMAVKKVFNNRWCN